MKARVDAKQIIKLILKIVYQLLMLLCVLLILIIVFQKITDSNRTIMGYRIFRVITGSMEPEYNIGEVVICKETNPKSIEVGDDIVYRGVYGEYNGKIIMHQVVGIDKEESGELTFHAQGLHIASIEDPLIKEDQIFGVVKFKSGILTALYKLATSIYSAFIIVTILVFNVFVSFRVTGKKHARRLAESAEFEEEYDEEYEESQEFEEDIDEESYENEEVDEEDIEDSEEEQDDE